MAEDKRYNGWTNYETWNVALWIGNEQHSERYWSRQAADHYTNAEAERSFTRAERAALNLADQLKAEHEEAMQAMLDEARAGTSMWADLIGAALSEVNWLEIAEHYINDVKEDIDAEEPEKE